MQAGREPQQIEVRRPVPHVVVCMDAELGVLPIDDVTLGRMKREKLLAKQRLLRMYETPLATSSPTH